MPRSSSLRRVAFLPLAFALVALTALGCACAVNQSAGQEPRSAAPGIAPATPGPAATPPLPSDPSLLTLVSKDRSLAPNYAPDDLIPISAEFTSSDMPQRLRRPAAEALTQMLAQARREGVMIKVNSGFRSYDYQSAVLTSEIASVGCATALLDVAAPGHSEHQLGLAADLTSADEGWDLKETFGTEPEGKWLLAHAAAYGFVLSYPKDKEAVTGYAYEPWHFRFVTIPVAEAIAASGKTPTEFLQALGAPAETNTQHSTAPPPRGCR